MFKPDEREQVPPSTVKVLADNIAGAVRAERTDIDSDGFRVIHALAERIAVEQPQFVALQEVCGVQVEQLMAELDKLSSTVNGQVWTDVAGQPYRTCFLTHEDCSKGAGISWRSTGPVDECEFPEPDDQTPPAVRSAVCDMAYRG